MLKDVLLDYNPIIKITNGLFSSVPLLADIADHIKGLIFNKDDQNLEKLLFLVGVAAITYKTTTFISRTWQSWKWVPEHIINQSKLNGPALKDKYGDCWVVITGFTEGIGHGFAEIFAQFGFNLILINRNAQKTTRKAKQLQNHYKHIKIEHVVCDLADKGQIQRLQNIFRQFEGLDIGIVVNNAGSVASGPFFSIKPELLVQDINVDLLAIFVINRIMLPRLRARDKRSAILNVASCTGVFLSSRVGVYSSTKRTVDVYTRILDLENNDKIDVVSIRPFGVTTKMMKMKKGPLMITPRDCAYSSLADALAGKKLTYSHFKHKLSAIAFQHLTELQSFQLYDYYWAQGRKQAED